MKKTILLSLFLFSIIGQLGSSPCIPNLRAIQKPSQTRLMFSADRTRVSMISTMKIPTGTQTEQRNPIRQNVDISQPQTIDIPQPQTIDIPQRQNVEIPQMDNEPNVIPPINVDASMPRIVNIRVSGIENISETLINTLKLLAKRANNRCDNTESL